jgi:hypothetical protein
MGEPYWTIDGQDAYEILEVDTGASADQIRRAYRRHSRHHHPDAGGRTEQQSRLNDAYHTLSDPGRRSAYDRARDGGSPAGAPPDPSDLQWTYGTGPANPPGRTAGSPPATPTQWSSDVLLLAMSFTVLCLVNGTLATVWIAVTTGGHAGLGVLVWLGVGVACVTFVATLGGAERPLGLALPLGIALLAGPVLAPAGAVVVGRFGGWHAGVALLAWAGTVTSCLIYCGVLAEVNGRVARVAGVAAWSGLHTALTAGGCVAATAWLGDLSGWHAGIIALLWIGGTTSSLSYLAMLAHLSQQPAATRLARTALTAGGFPLLLLAGGTAATAAIGASSGWHAGILLLVWLAVAMGSIIYAHVRAHLR